MSSRRILLAALALSAFAPATAQAAPTVTATGDDGNPVTLNPTAPTGFRQMNVSVNITVPRADTRFFNAQVLDPAGGAATPLSECTAVSATTETLQGSPGYHGNGPYTVVIKYYGDENCTGTARETRSQYAVNAGSTVTAPPAKLLTRAPDSFITNTHQLGVTLNPGAVTYEVRYALGGVIGPDGAITGASTEAFVDTATGLAGFRFEKPGRYVGVSRAETDGVFTPWSPPTIIDAIAPFDLAPTAFPDSRGPSYKLRGQVREHSARGKVTIYLAKGKKKGKFHRIGKAKINKKGRFTKRFTTHKTGVYRLRYTYKGSSLVASGRVTERIHITRHFFFR
jgi:hypothetical protein